MHSTAEQHSSLEVFLDLGQLLIREPQRLGDITVEATVFLAHGAGEGIPAFGLEAAEVVEARGFLALGAGSSEGEAEEELAGRLGAYPGQEEVQRHVLGGGAGEAEQETPEHTGAISPGCVALDRRIK